MTDKKSCGTARTAHADNLSSPSRIAKAIMEPKTHLRRFDSPSVHLQPSQIDLTRT